MKRSGLSILALLSFIIGLLFLMSGFQITGFAISDALTISSGLSTYIGIIFVLLGISIFLVQNTLEKEVSDTYDSTHDEAHNAANYQRLRESLGREQKEAAQAHRDEVLQRHYGPPPSVNDNEKWITLFHAFPRGKFHMKPGELVNKKMIKGGGFYMAEDAVSASEEIADVPEFDRSILKIKIAASVFDDLGLQNMSSHINAQTTGLPTYKLPKKKIDLLNEFYRRGYVIVGRGR